MDMLNRVYTAISVFFRMGIGLLVFAALARSLGPEQYGLFSTVLSAATIASLIADFGFGPKTLRDIAAEPGRGRELLTSALVVKCAFSLIAAIILLVVIILLPLSASEKLAAAMIAAGVFIAAIGDLALVAFRSKAQYSKETWIVVITSSFYGVIILGIALLGGGTIIVSAAFLLSRLFYTGVALFEANKLFPHDRLRLPKAGLLLTSLRSSTFWALDSGLGFISGQVDGLVVAHVLGLTQAGLYQAGSRFVQAALGMTVILLYIHIPRLADNVASSVLRGRERRMMFEFFCLGAVFGVFILFGGPYLTRFVLGPGYTEVDRLWPGFTAFVLARYIASAFGVALSAQARPILRVGAQTVGLIVIGTGFATKLPSLGIEAVPWIMAAGAAVTAGMYALGYIAGRSAPDQ